jgi:hypothetical protein
VDEQEQRSIELAKTYFELFKHLSTLGLAVAAGVVAAYGLDVADLATITACLAAFAVSVLICLVGLQRSLDALHQELTNFQQPLYKLSVWAMVALFVGAFNFTAEMARIPEPVQWLVLLSAVVGAFFYLRWRR